MPMPPCPIQRSKRYGPSDEPTPHSLPGLPPKGTECSTGSVCPASVSSSIGSGSTTRAMTVQFRSLTWPWVYVPLVSLHMGMLWQPDERVSVALHHYTTVGRSPSADITISDPRISSQHAVLYWNGNSWMVKDLSSRNGTFLNRRRLEPGQR